MSTVILKVFGKNENVKKSVRVKNIVFWTIHKSVEFKYCSRSTRFTNECVNSYAIIKKTVDALTQTLNPFLPISGFFK